MSQTKQQYGQQFANESLISNMKNCSVGDSVTITYKSDSGLKVSKYGTVDKIETVANSIDIWIKTNLTNKAYIHVNTKTKDLYFQSGSRKQVKNQLIKLE